MHGNLPAQAQRAIFPAVQMDSERLDAAADGAITVHLDSESSGWFSKLARNLWRQKPAAALAFLTTVPERQCYRYISDQPREPPAIIIARLLRSSEGLRVLGYIMRGCKEAWWRDMRTAWIAFEEDQKRDAAVNQRVQAEFEF